MAQHTDSPTPDSPLWERIRAFSFDEPGTQFTFAARLARENGWDHGYAWRVLDEYRKFMFLAATGDHVMTPSEDVDHAFEGIGRAER